MFFGRGAECPEHIIRIGDRNVQIPCTGLKICSVSSSKELPESGECRPARYVCSECFISEGGHFFERGNQGHKTFSCEDKHSNDTTEALKLLGHWILSIAESAEQEYKEVLLVHLSSMLSMANKKASQVKPSSLIYIKAALRLNRVDIVKVEN